MKLLYRLLHLETSDRQLLVATFVLLVTIRLGLWLLPFPTWRRLLTQATQARANLQQVEPTSINKVVWAVSVASRYMPGGVKCLARALATQVLLNWYGHAAKLCLGVAKGEEGKLEAHAWVESQGKVVMGGLSNLSSFTPLSCFEGDRL